jgi:hypothetical protein
VGRGGGVGDTAVRKAVEDVLIILLSGSALIVALALATIKALEVSGPGFIIQWASSSQSYTALLFLALTSHKIGMLYARVKKHSTSRRCGGLR